MKRAQLLSHLKKYGCIIIRNGSNHDIYQNPANGKISAIGRHAELDNLYCRIICKQLQIPVI